MTDAIRNWKDEYKRESDRQEYNDNIDDYEVDDHR